MARRLHLVHFAVQRVPVRVAVWVLSAGLTGLARFLLCLTRPYS